MAVPSAVRSVSSRWRPVLQQPEGDQSLVARLQRDRRRQEVERCQPRPGPRGQGPGRGRHGGETTGMAHRRRSPGRRGSSNIHQHIQMGIVGGGGPEDGAWGSWKGSKAPVVAERAVTRRPPRSDRATRRRTPGKAGPDRPGCGRSSSPPTPDRCPRDRDDDDREPDNLRRSRRSGPPGSGCSPTAARLGPPPRFEAWCPPRPSATASTTSGTPTPTPTASGPDQRPWPPGRRDPGSTRRPRSLRPTVRSRLVGVATNLYGCAREVPAEDRSDRSLPQARGGLHRRSPRRSTSVPPSDSSIGAHRSKPRARLHCSASMGLDRSF